MGRLTTQPFQVYLVAPQVYNGFFMNVLQWVVGFMAVIGIIFLVIYGIKDVIGVIKGQSALGRLLAKIAGAVLLIAILISAVYFPKLATSLSGSVEKASDKLIKEAGDAIDGF